MTDNRQNMYKEKGSVDLVKEHISKGNVNEAIEMLNELLDSSTFPCNADELYYLRGNAYSKLGNWQQALNNYLEAMNLNPQSPAVHAREMIMNILEFYNKDMYNQ